MPRHERPRETSDTSHVGERLLWEGGSHCARMVLRELRFESASRRRRLRWKASAPRKWETQSDQGLE